MVNDPIGDMIIQIKNACLAGKKNITLPYSRVKREIADILCQEGYLDSVKISGENPQQNLLLSLSYSDKKPILIDVKRKSKPGLRLYVDKTNIPKVVGGMGIAIISTSKGIMTGKDAKKQGIGGELLCEIW